MYYCKDNRNLGNDFHGKKKRKLHEHCTVQSVDCKSYIIMSHGESLLL